MMHLMDQVLLFVRRHRTLLLPCALLCLMAVLVVPLTPRVMDALVVMNFTLAALVMVRAASIRQPLEFSVFPALLLGTTLLRLVTNVASTRMILGAEAPSPETMQGVAGQLIEAFGMLVAGRSVVVGGVIFAILVVVQFVVITKGAGRMSEVAARFALDALPGRQMAIDADLAAGAIDETQAQKRRDALVREADFFGAMDGASKFVRGDAVAGLLITLVNVLGGFAVCVLQKGWSVGETLRTVTVLTVGDGLAAQIPAFVVAIGAGLVMARTGRGRTLGEDLPAQLAGNPATLMVLAVFLSMLALTSLPTLPLLACAALLGLGAWMLAHDRARRGILGRGEQGAGVGHAGITAGHPSLALVEPRDQGSTGGRTGGRAGVLPGTHAGGVPGGGAFRSGEGRALPAPGGSRSMREAGASGLTEDVARRAAEIGALLTVEPLEVELGASLTPLVREGERSALLRRIEGIRRQIAQDLGIVAPPVHVHDQRQLGANMYRIKIRGAVVGEGELRMEDLLAMSDDGHPPALPGIPAREPAFGLNAVWIAPSLRSLAESRRCVVAPPESVLGTHLATLLRRHADELLTREHVVDLLDQLRGRAPRLVEELVPEVVRPGELQRVMQLLLRERVPVRDLEAILEAVGDALTQAGATGASQERTVGALAEAARLALRRTICQQYLRPDGHGRATLTCLVAGADVEAALAALVHDGSDHTTPSGSNSMPGSGQIIRAVAAAARPLAEAGLPVVVVCSRSVRAQLARLIAPHIPGSATLAHDELVQEVQVERLRVVELGNALHEESTEVHA